ncbi:putative Phytocyanin domain, cupredoxin [Helianthus annuus]|nr:putative Phytocyanin domain, cupredoxin [Helianthus annuus]KAJ0889438.1 putative Phytocyanin domain, cupredoxin [Helianthus annuus]
MGRSNGGSRWAMVVALAFCATLVILLPEVSAKRFIVGGNMGWTSNVNYTLWAGNQTFYFGDWLYLLVFVYDRNQNDVIEVNQTNYETCNAEHPIHNYTTGAGRDVVALNVTHDRYFISSKGACYGGMKLHVHLSPLPPPPKSAPAKSHSSRFTVLRSQLVIPAVLAVAAIWDSLLLRV